MALIHVQTKLDDGENDYDKPAKRGSVLSATTC